MALPFRRQAPEPPALTLAELPPEVARRIRSAIDALGIGAKAQGQPKSERHLKGEKHASGPWEVTWEAQVHADGSLAYLIFDDSRVDEAELEAVNSKITITHHGGH